MAQIIVRNLDDEVKRSLKARAARRGRSMEQEVRDILTASVATPPPVREGLGARIAARFASVGLDEALPELRGETARPASFDP
jgi:plasmid stability protein